MKYRVCTDMDADSQKKFISKSHCTHCCCISKSTIQWWILLGVCCLAILTGCGGAPVLPKLEPDFGIPETWSTAEFDVQGNVDNNWISSFGDMQLQSLVDEAMARNYDLQLLTARLDAARAQATIAGADRLPQINVGANLNKQRVVYETELGRGHEELDRYNLRADISWELDVWGKLENLAEAGFVGAKAAEEDLAAARLLLAAKVTKAWFDAVEARLQRVLAEKTVASYTLGARNIKKRYSVGVNSALDLRLALTELANAQATLQSKKSQYQEALRALQVLLGRYPDGDIAVLQQLPSIERDVPAGLPSSLLHRRPDLRAAHKRLVAADLRVVSAQKDLLPSFTLTGSAGTASEMLHRVVDGRNIIWELVGGLLHPVFQGGRLRAVVKQSQAESQEALFSYWNKALIAFREVEAAMVTEGFLSKREFALGDAVEQAEAAEKLALGEYSLGVAGIITMLESQRSVFQARSDLLTVRNFRLQNRVNLHLALGGHFEGNPAGSKSKDVLP